MANVSITAQQKTAIGTGIKNPVSFSDFKQNQLLELSDGLDRINEAIYDILNTRVGERFNNVEYGSQIQLLTFEPNDQVLKDLLYFNVVTVLQRWERRITVTDVQMFTDEEQQATLFGVSNQGGSLINIVIAYIVNTTHQPGTFVFPFVRNAEPTSELTQGKEALSFTYPTIK